jgi:hypothetical protein
MAEQRCSVEFRSNFGRISVEFLRISDFGLIVLYPAPNDSTGLDEKGGPSHTNAEPLAELDGTDPDRSGSARRNYCVGREAVSDRLRAAWENVRAGRPHSVLLLGPADIGKTTLVESLSPADRRRAGLDGALQWVLPRP